MDSDVKDLMLDVSSQESVDFARRELRTRSRLDPSQADAVMDTLTREVALIQGPPGTGKSFTGVEILRVLLANRVRPILMIAYTNHALDHMLCSVLDAKITENIVRLGSRSADERISQFSIETREMVAGRSRLSSAFGRNHHTLKTAEEKIKTFMHELTKTTTSSEDIVRFLSQRYPEHYDDFLNPPRWISPHYNAWVNEEEGWRTARRSGQATARDLSRYAYWAAAEDLVFLERARHLDELSVSQEIIEPTLKSATIDKVDEDETSESDVSDDSEDDVAPEEQWKFIVPPVVSAPLDVTLEKPALPSPAPVRPPSPIPQQRLNLSDLRDPIEFFEAHGCIGVPLIPDTVRRCGELLDSGEMWTLSRAERQELHAFWTEQVLGFMNESRQGEFQRLRREHSDAQRKYMEGKDEAKRDLLQNIDIVGCTTTGAAKLGSLLHGLAPQIMLVEEAGQVLEAHVLGSLVPSVQHLILIGDPLQLRPTLNNYSLSMDSRQGSELYKFDMSLMERLSRCGFPMSQIDVQRRMRPSIANLIRNTLYPKLQDHELVTHYPSVRGFARDVFFMTHDHKENGGVEESASKYNMFEVEMIKVLVMYLLRQGCYLQEGDIVVLCAYLGQLARVRDALAKEVAVIIDERDQTALADHENGEELAADLPAVEHVHVSRRVRLRTIDNYQGEEAKIVILSLVRNSGSLDDEDAEILGRKLANGPNIGFLKSENRTNVALSRAREGLFILGNAFNLSARSSMWRAIIEMLEENDAVGEGIPIACHRHPENARIICNPRDLPLHSPDGGCTMPCSERLRCGHICPFKCHPDDPGHVSVTCYQSCAKLCPRGHPCGRICSEPCGDCQFPVSDVELPCGHRKATVSCHMLGNLDEVFCEEVVIKELSSCSHSARVHCSEDPATHRCETPCAGLLPCCGRECSALCYQCKRSSADTNSTPAQVAHRRHSCQRTLYCEHLCQNPCSVDHSCTIACARPCRQKCTHARCKSSCSTPCSPCQERCTWVCAHFSCPVPCGSVCTRLPCDRPCNQTLRCGHQCSSVCGEDCNIQICLQCASDTQKHDVVDLIMQSTLADISSDGLTLDARLIRLPDCSHFFTVETLDGVCGLTDYYIRDEKTGMWTGLRAPPAAAEVTKPPACPTCRTPITAPRYGRVFKPANLGILERNVASQMSERLAHVRHLVNSASPQDAQLALSAAAASVKVSNAFDPSKKEHKRRKARGRLLKDDALSQPMGPAIIDPENNLLYGVFHTSAKAFVKVVPSLVLAYRSACQVAQTRSSHIDAWESAFSCLYRHELESATKDPARAPRRPEEHAMRIARMNVGFPKPLVDKRFAVEAIWDTLQIRLTLANLAQKWREALRERNPAHSPADLQAWATYIGYILDTCVRDVGLARRIAEESGAHRQVVKTASYTMLVDLDKFRFNLSISRELGFVKDNREEWIGIATQRRKEAEEFARTTQAALDETKPKSAAARAQWDDLKAEFSMTARTALTEYEALESSVLRGETFYEAVSIQDQMSVVRAFAGEFTHTGHFYNCPNGHMFVIGECGGAMQRAVCPECGEAIGGSGHTLTPGNTRNEEMERLSREQGARQSPWTWGR